MQTKVAQAGVDRLHKLQTSRARFVDRFLRPKTGVSRPEMSDGRAQREWQANGADHLNAERVGGVSHPERAASNPALGGAASAGWVGGWGQGCLRASSGRVAHQRLTVLMSAVRM